MLIAREKERENVVEFILYMWQMEDLVRGNNLDLDAVMQKFFSEKTPESIRQEYKNWFKTLIDEMVERGLEKTGHVQSVLKYMDALEELHKSLITTYQDKDYIKLYDNSREDIKSLRQKGMSPEMDEIEVCLVGLYGILLLRMSQTPISADTERAIQSIGKMMSYLSDAFRKRNDGSLKFPNEMNN